jgi:uncharacterized protein YndB with AHSA1/START domain
MNPQGSETMLTKIAVLIVVLIAGILIFAATKPNQLQIERTARIAAPPETIFALINDFHHWPLWAPQDRDDPKMRRTYAGAPSGVGAISEWQGAGNTGQGHMQIVASDPPRSLTVRVDFAKPFTAHNINEFTLVPVGTTTEITWRMRGTNPPIAKLMSVFISMDRMMGKHFESGLANLKAAAESPPGAANPAPDRTPG